MAKIKVKKIKSDAPVSMEYYPEFTLDVSQLPEMKDWEVGKKYDLEVQVEMTGMNKSQYDTENKLKGSFKILKVSIGEDDTYKK